MLKLGFLGTGWIGRNRMQAMLATGEASAAAVCDPSPGMLEEAKAIAPLALETESLEAMLALELDAVVIATPSALHAEQCIKVLNAGKAVFCQKPLGRTAAEVGRVIEAARRADKLLGVDLSYRETAAVQAIRTKLADLGRPFAADLVFHNAYGPGAGWFWDPALSGGGCLIDLGVHLVDLALWLFDFPDVIDAHSTLLKSGKAITSGEVEDFALVELKLANGVTVRIACSWNLHAGADAVIGASFYGTNGSLKMQNEQGSFFDFSAQWCSGRDAQQLVAPPDDWGGRMAAKFVTDLTTGAGFEGSTSGLVQTAQVLDRCYGRA